MARNIIGTHNLKFAIIRETKGGDGEIREEVLKPAGFEVVVRRPLARDMKIMDQYEGRLITGSLAMLAAITNLDADEIDLLDAEDMDGLGNFLIAGSVIGQKIGESA